MVKQYGLAANEETVYNRSVVVNMISCPYCKVCLNDKDTYCPQCNARVVVVGAGKFLKDVINIVGVIGFCVWSWNVNYMFFDTAWKHPDGAEISLLFAGPGVFLCFYLAYIVRTSVKRLLTFAYGRRWFPGQV